MSNSSKAWERATLGDVCQVLAGYGFPKHLQGKASGDLPFYKVGDISEAWKRGDTYLDKANHYISLREAREIRARPLPENSTAFAKIGAAIALNRRAILSQPSLVDNNVMALHPATEALDHKFLFHFICTVKLDELSRATTVPSIRKSDIEQIAIPLPPLVEQKAIVAEIEKQFTRLDAGVAALHRVQANLKRYRAAVLKSAFEGRLVPTEAELAKVEGRTCETGEQLLARILADRRKNWHGRGKYKEPAAPDTTNLPPLPEGWTWGTAEQLTSLITDGEHITPRRTASGVYLLSARNVLDGRISLETVDYVPQDEYERIARRLTIDPGDVLLSCSGSVGRSTIVPEGLTFTLVRSVAVLKPMLATGRYLSLALRSPLLRSQISARQTQTAQANIFQGKIKTLCFPLPPLSEQARLVTEVERRLSVVEELEAAVTANLQRAIRLRQSILRRAFGLKKGEVHDHSD